MKTKFTLLTAVTLAFVAIAAPAAQASTFTPDSQIQYALEHEPGGYATSAHSAYWPETGMTMTSGLGISTFAVGSCATGAICAYSGYSLTGSKLSWTACATFSTSALPMVRSIANARSSGTLRARNVTTVVATTGPGGQANVSTTVTNVQCS